MFSTEFEKTLIITAFTFFSESYTVFPADYGVLQLYPDRGK